MQELSYPLVQQPSDKGSNFGQRWWMVFDHPPCNNNEVPQYFLRKLYCDFVKNKVPNYFDMRDFQGRGGGLA